MRGAWLAGIPGPWSATDITRPSGSCLTVTVTLPSPWRSAFSIRLSMTCPNLSGSTQTSGSRFCDVDDESVRLDPGNDLGVQSATHQAPQVRRYAPKLEPPSVDPCDVEEFSDQSRQSISVAINRFEHKPTLILTESIPLVEQRRRESLDTGQR